MVEFEIGVVYKKHSKHFIAVATSTLVSCKGGNLYEVKPSTRYKAVRSISVEDLCESWNVSLRQFDTMMADYLKPQGELKTRPRGPRVSKGDDEEYWRRHRTGRIARINP
jgi:hypothetical protein